MKNNSRKSGIIITALGLLMTALISCSGYNTMIKKLEVKSIPEDKYERIIKLSNPEGMPDRSLAGLIFIKKGAGGLYELPARGNHHQSRRAGIDGKKCLSDPLVLMP